MEENDSKTYELCGIKFNSERFTDFHIIREHELENFKYAKKIKELTCCSICDFKVTDIETCDRHMSYKHKHISEAGVKIKKLRLH